MDSETKCMNREIKMYFHLYYVNYFHTWTEKLSAAEFMINNWVHSAMKHTPFFLIYDSHPWSILAKYLKTKILLVEQWLLNKIRINEDAQAAIKLAQQIMARRGK